MTDVHPDPNPEKLYTLKEVAELFSMSPRTVRDWVRFGKIKAFKIGGSGPWRVTRSEVLRLGNEHFGA